MQGHVIQLCNAGIREQEFAQQCVKDGKFPVGVTFKDVLDHGIYDASADEIVVTVKACVYNYKVTRA